MSNLVSFDYLLRLFTFIYIIPISIMIEDEIQYAFLNGLNVVRCSNDELQVYRQERDAQKIKVISELVICDNWEDIYLDEYVGFLWRELKVICSTDNTRVHVEQDIEIKFYGRPGVQLEVPIFTSKFDQSTEFYDVQHEYDASTHTIKLITNDQAANEAYFSENNETKEKTIYIWFQDHPILCRVKFTGGVEKNPCPSMADRYVGSVNYACYYNPGTEEMITVAEMEAELKQAEEAGASMNEEAFMLNLTKPVCVEWWLTSL